MKKLPVHVSDHAVLRYLERVGGFNIDDLRRSIATRIEVAAPTGASAVVLDGFKYVIRAETGQRVVTTIMPREWDHHNPKGRS